MEMIGKGFLSSCSKTIAVLVAVAALTACGGKTYNHDEFSSMVMNKSEAEVKTALGEPSWINDGKPAMWIYRHKTFDASKNQEDDKVTITFGTEGANQDKVVDIRYE